MSYDDEIGALPPLGFWDPLGFCQDENKVAFTQRRAAEVKHGRIAMLAVVGYVVAEYARLPGTIDLDGTTFQSLPNGIDALKAFPSVGWASIAFFIGFMELFGFKQVPGSVIGDFGVGVFGRPLEDRLKVDQANRELQNGRLAMVGITELLTHDVARPAGESLLSLHF
eukprot:gene5068-5567_t